MLGSSSDVACELPGRAEEHRSLQGAGYVAVEHFSLDIEAGACFCLLGPSGCGKTTVLKMLAGFEGPTAGQIVMKGRPVTAASRDHAEHPARCRRGPHR